MARRCWMRARARAVRTRSAFTLPTSGYLVCGDPAYLNGGELGDMQTLDVDDPPLCLHASSITFTHPLHQEPVTFTAPSPSWARGAMNLSYTSRSSVEAIP